jgi:hypothetical protein
MQDIDDIVDEALNKIQSRENAYTNITSFRDQFDVLCQQVQRVVHEQLSSLVELQRQVLEKSDELQILPELLRDDIILDSQLQTKLNPNIFHQTPTTYEFEPMISSQVTTTADKNISVKTESIPTSMDNEPVLTTNTNKLLDDEPILTTKTNKLTDNEPIITTSNTNTSMSSEPKTLSNENATIHVEPTVELTNNYNPNNSTTDSTDQDEFEAGLTAHIQRRNPIIISANNDRFAGTLCSHKNQLVYNDHNQRTRNIRLVLIPDISQPTTRQNIDWYLPNTIIGGGDDNWIQDITYSSKLRGYLLLNRSRLRLLHDDTYELEEFHQFPDRSMKRVACDDKYIYLIVAAGITAQHGDEIIIMNYEKEEKVCKTFRDVILTRNHRMTGPLVGEISDISLSPNGEIILGYRLERRREIGICLYKVSNDGTEWSLIKQLLLNECWHDDLSHTPRIEWCEKFNVFILVEYLTGHVILLDQTGQVRGECRFTNVQNRREMPINITASNNDWLCVRYDSSINIHRLEDLRS